MFMFQEGNDQIARMRFQKIAETTHGAYYRLDQGSARQLAELLKAVTALLSVVLWRSNVRDRMRQSFCLDRSAKPIRSNASPDEAKRRSVSLSPIRLTSAAVEQPQRQVATVRQPSQPIRPGANFPDRQQHRDPLARFHAGEQSDLPGERTMQDAHAISASKSRRWWQLDQAVHFPRLERGDHRIGDDGRRDPVHHQADDTRRPSRLAPLQWIRTNT